MQFSLGGEIRLMGNVRLVKIPKVNFLAVKVDMSRELLPSLVI
jgi:hypothetical protein